MFRSPDVTALIDNDLSPHIQRCPVLTHHSHLRFDFVEVDIKYIDQIWSTFIMTGLSCPMRR